MTEDIYTEPDLDPHTLANLGPLTGMAGVWQGTKGTDVHPVVDGTETDPYVERYELQPIDPQTNGPQAYYGLRYHCHITKPGEVETFHDQVGYWLWEPATQTVVQTIAIPRGLVLLASGTAEPDAHEFELTARADDPHWAIRANPFLDRAFRTVEFRITVTVDAPGQWTYDEDTVLQVEGRPAPFHHTDRHTLGKIADAEPNPLAR